jgi:hypothetical protein
MYIREIPPSHAPIFSKTSKPAQRGSHASLLLTWAHLFLRGEVGLAKRRVFDPPNQPLSECEWVSVCARACVCVCVWERERERERERFVSDSLPSFDGFHLMYCFMLQWIAYRHLGFYLTRGFTHKFSFMLLFDILLAILLDWWLDYLLIVSYFKWCLSIRLAHEVYLSSLIYWWFVDWTKGLTS